MRKDRIILSAEEISSRRTNNKDKTHKIKNVLRKRPSDYIYLLDGCGKEYRAKIQRNTTSIMEFDIENVEKTEKQNTCRIVLGFSLLKSAKTDFVLQKCTELGIDEFTPFVSRYSIAKHPGKTKVKHWQRKTDEAVCQSGRLYRPQLKPVRSFSDLIKTFIKFDAVLAGWKDSRNMIIEELEQSVNRRISRILLLVGPEGGFSEKESQQLRQHPNVKLVSLSKYVLRAETAAIFLSGLLCGYLKRS